MSKKRNIEMNSENNNDLQITENIENVLEQEKEEQVSGNITGLFEQSYLSDSETDVTDDQDFFSETDAVDEQDIASNKSKHIKAAKLTLDKVTIHEMINFDKKPENPVKVSIVMPVCNVEQYLRECIDSCINQTLRDIEIICVNDGSTDSCSEILREYAEKDERVKVVNKDNAGYGHTMNLGMDLAQGEYIGIVESDDYVELNMYETLYNIAVSNELDIVKSDFCRFTHDDKGAIKKELNRVAARAPELYNTVTSAAEDQRVFHLVMQTWSGIYRKEFLDKHNIRHNETPGASYQDNGFWFQTFMHAKRVYFYDEPFYMNRRDNPNSSVHNKGKVYCMNEEYRFIKELMLDDPELFEQYKYEYSRKKFANYMFTYRRIGDEFKWEYLQTMHEELTEAENNSEIDWRLFDKGDRENLLIIMKDPQEFFTLEIKKIVTASVDKELKKVKADNLRYVQQIENYKSEVNSISKRMYSMWKSGSTQLSKSDKKKAHRNDLLNNSKAHIAFVTDDNYCMPTSVAITSLKINRYKDTDYCIHIIANGISHYNKSKLMMLQDKNFSIDIINVSLDKEFQAITKKDKDLHVSASAILKLRLPQILKDIGKVLYIDGDVLLQRDLLELYNININNKYAGVVKDIISERNINHIKNIGIKNRYYFNSGMMLLNLTKMRKDNMTEKLIQYRKVGKNHFVDQDTLNVVFGEKVEYISWQYNYLNKFHDWWNSEKLSVFYGEIVPEDKIAAFKSAAILHLGSHEKPWVYKMGYLSSLYRKYYNKSPYSDVKLQLAPLPTPNERLIRISDNEALTQDALIEKLLWNRQQKQMLEQKLKDVESRLTENPYKVYAEINTLTQENDGLSYQLNTANYELDNIKNSFSFKVGRFITWLPRKIRELFKK